MGELKLMKLKIFSSGRYRKLWMVLRVCGQIMKEETTEYLYPRTKISLMEKIIRVETMQEKSLLKSMDQTFIMNCRCFSLKGQFVNVVKL